MRRKSNQRDGFTLIETLVYLALYAIIIGGSLSALYALIESDDHNQAAAMIQEEGAFLVGKIDWILAHARSVQLPLERGSTLSVTEFDGSTAVIRYSDNNLSMQTGAHAAEVLHNDHVSISSLMFNHLSGIHAYDPESVEAVMTITATTSSGRVLSRDFSTRIYLRR